MDITFSVRPDGQVDAHVPSAGWLFNKALADSISSLPPRGAPGNGPSTYWVDEALDGLHEAQRTSSDGPFIDGNSTFLRLVGSDIEARHDFAEDDEVGDLIGVEDFIRLLEAWRVRILEQAATAHEPLPATYRRNPAR